MASETRYKPFPLLPVKKPEWGSGNEVLGLVRITTYFEKRADGTW